ncbi:hypothetical protein OG372_17755 [Streptomyces sp. NBC_01020]|uniref:hypothetical protein n=1 Tax=unclassified Streptomyces TaxID=2593676 RepID=UPI002E1A472C|nr:hypothetical protein OG372_17755 [Streptomyces sp. NBC_01020]WSX68651.1 hypothetical protein OG221_19605 [Streptomyces sp. NBC_00932]
MRIGDAVHGLLCEAIDRLSVRGDVVDQAAAVVVERAELGDPGPVPDVVRLRGHVEHLGGHRLFKEADHGLSGAPERLHGGELALGPLWRIESVRQLPGNDAQQPFFGLRVQVAGARGEVFDHARMYRHSSPPPSFYRRPECSKHQLHGEVGPFDRLITSAAWMLASRRSVVPLLAQ